MVYNNRVVQNMRLKIMSITEILQSGLADIPIVNLVDIFNGGYYTDDKTIRVELNNDNELLITDLTTNKEYITDSLSITNLY